MTAILVMPNSFPDARGRIRPTPCAARKVASPSACDNGEDGCHDQDRGAGRLAGHGARPRGLVGAEARAEVSFFQAAFADVDDAAAKLADFDIVLSMRERTPLPGPLINRLPKLRMLGMTGARNRLARHRGLHGARASWSATPARAAPRPMPARPRPRRLALGLLIAAARAHPAAATPRSAPAGFQEDVPHRHRSRRQDAGRDRPGPARRANGALRQGAAAWRCWPGART